MAKRHCRPSAQYRYEHYDPQRSRDDQRPPRISGWPITGRPRRPADGRSVGASQLGHGRRAADGGAAEDGVAVVEDRGLAEGHAAGRVVQADAYRVAVQPCRAGVHLAVGA